MRLGTVNIDLELGHMSKHVRRLAKGGHVSRHVDKCPYAYRLGGAANDSCIAVDLGPYLER